MDHGIVMANMNEAVFIDTNIILWLAKGNFKKFSRIAKKTIFENEILYSPMVRLEIEYLHEIGKITRFSGGVFDSLRGKIEISESQSNFADVCREAIKIGWTRDTFDRLIVAEAMLHKGKLVTGDERILKHYKRAVW